MSPATEILVIILSVFLAIFLALAIALVIYLIVLTRQIRRVTDKAEKAVDNIGSVASGLSKVISPLFMVEILSNLVKKFRTKKKGGKDVES